MIGHSLEPAVSEEQFLRRELGLTWEQVTCDDLQGEIRHRHDRGLRTAVICSEPEAYAEALASAPKGSVVLVLISDEGYSESRRRLVQFTRSVHSVYRQYPARPASSSAIAAAVAGFIGDARGTSQSGRTALPNGRKGRETRRRMQEWAQISTPVRDVPLGYTHAFVDAFLAAYAPDADLDRSLFDTPVPSRERAISVTFRGNRGLAARIVGMERAARLPDSDITTIDADWSGFAHGDVGRTYVDALSSARFALCPPGFVNNESFRFYEALLCGALPLELEVALTHQGRLIARDRNTIHASSWRRGLTVATSMDEAARQRRVASARTLVQQTLRTVRSAITADVEG